MSVLREANQVINPKLSEMGDMARALGGGKGRNRWRNTGGEGRGGMKSDRGFGERNFSGSGRGGGDRQQYGRGNMGRDRDNDRSRSSDRRGEGFGNRGGRGGFSGNTGNPQSFGGGRGGFSNNVGSQQRSSLGAGSQQRSSLGAGSQQRSSLGGNYNLPMNGPSSHNAVGHNQSPLLPNNSYSQFGNHMSSPMHGGPGMMNNSYYQQQRS